MHHARPPTACATDSPRERRRGRHRRRRALASPGSSAAARRPAAARRGRSRSPRPTRPSAQRSQPSASAARRDARACPAMPGMGGTHERGRRRRGHRRGRDDRDPRVRPRLHAGRDRRSRPPGRTTVTFVNDGATTHDITFADGTKLSADAEADGDRHGRPSRPRASTFLCSIPGHAAGGHDRVDHGRRGRAGGRRRRARPPSPTTAAPVADPNAPPYVLRDADRPGRPGRHGPRHRLADHRDGHDRRQGLRRPRLDVRRDGPRAGHPGPPRRHGPRPPDQPDAR